MGDGAVDSSNAGSSFTLRGIIDVDIDRLVLGVDGRHHALGHVGAPGEEELEDASMGAEPLVRLEQRNVLLVGQLGSEPLDVHLGLLFDADIGEVFARIDLLVLLFAVPLLLGMLQLFEAVRVPTKGKQQ